MKIYLFLNTKILTFSLPKDISGSYSFDYDNEEESKLINIEARDSKWVMYSTNESSIVSNGMELDSVVLKSDAFYNVKKNDELYLVYAIDISENVLSIYQYTDKVNLIIGNTNDCNVKYDFGLKTEVEVNVFKKDNVLRLEKTKGNIYVNGFGVTKNMNLKIGDVVNIFGLKITFLNNMILVNHIPSKLTVLDMESGLSKYVFPNDEEPVNREVKDIDLYNKNDYYSKSPRLKRIVEKKDIKLDSPPSDGVGQEMPLILTIGPMMTMGATSIVTIMSVLNRVNSNQTTIKEQLPVLAISGAMLISMLVWPLVTRLYNKHMQKVRKKELLVKYTKYLDEKKVELNNEEIVQKDIITENLLTTAQCIDIINQRKVSFWDKRVDQSDFLVTRIGIGDQKLDVEISYPEDGFTIDESELKKKADALVQEFKYIKNVPVSYSFYENVMTAIMGKEEKTVNFINNILLQLLTFYTYEDLKIVVITNENNERNWSYLKYLNHNFNNEKTVRFYATNSDSAKYVLDYLNFELSRRVSQNEVENIRPHYLILIDDYSEIKRHDFIKTLSEQEDDKNYGFSLIIKENLFKNLPGKCNNFITLNDGKSGILKNSYENQEQIIFTDEIVSNVDMMAVSKVLANIPIEFEEGVGQLPDSISFLEMEKVGKVEQLNILDRWNSNDSTASLRAEIGVDEQEDLMYLDLHEKFHGPHGLIAGTTGSGKSEFLITYILSMCINYSPDDVSFILIDYKGGGLALAFENRNSGVVLPHLAGTITNLDKAEMDRTLVSIDSEVKRRQKLFNDAKDKLNESTMDIYKYQRHFHEGNLDVPITHLFIICDEFAELKSQQPDFMDNLISVARIGRSLGVHLILATQKPSGVVNDQIWSNTRFRVCLKVQDESDSKEMLKKPDAAHLKQAGRYILQVGYDEYYAQGQSGWCGAKYYPSNKLVKQIDKSINFIDDCGQFIKSIQASGDSKVQAQGEQLQSVLKHIIDIANKVGKKARRLWLENIPETILVDNLEKQYSFVKENYHPAVIIGEYDAPEKQEQGKVVWDLVSDGNTAVLGTEGTENELLLNTIIYGLAKNYTPEEINIYAIDYGSESLRRFQGLPHVGGMAFQGDDETYGNLIKLLRDEMALRKKKFVDYGGVYSSYVKNSPNKMPLMLVIVNNFDSISESNNDSYDVYPDLVRDSDRYGIVYVFTGSGISSINRKIIQSLPNIYTYKLKDQYDYGSAFNVRTKVSPRDTFGRGLLNNDGVHEFQTAKILGDDDRLNAFIQDFVNKQKQMYKVKSKQVPKLPEIVRFDDIKDGIVNISNIPIGIMKNDLEIASLNLETALGAFITSNKMTNMTIFAKSFLEVLKVISSVNLLVIDPKNELTLDVSKYPNYYTKDLDNVTMKLMNYIKGQVDTSTKTIVLCIYNFSKFLSLLEDEKSFTDFMVEMAKKERLKIIIFDEFLKLKSYQFENWVKTSFTVSEGLWIGKGITDQSLFKVPSFSKDMTQPISNNMGYILNENNPSLCKLIDFISEE